ncbi:DUF4097 family beta strand repeat-containing protein [[Clostridium] polysaccharolyticum]|uniref:Putative adhesin n=1 Tax=[Clostridium] polysaccharolyticum TaxID=29364 RepID=A0A1I0ESN3_9FIRM|nr:DUF4097 family beta strand repeat-containing protein [[Clostridium] polysaccharolyticum]SET48389.1 Putative adhesin [[Clostridium] polysaccharolyticum]
MSPTQKGIKYVAMFLAVCLTISIIATIVKVGVGVMGAFIPSQDIHHQYNERGKKEILEGKEIVENFSGVENLKFDSGIYKVTFKADREKKDIKVAMHNISSSYSLKYDTESKTLVGKSHSWFSKFLKKEEDANGKIIVHIPRNQKLAKVEIDMGVGAVFLKKLEVEQLKIQCGVGALVCEDIKADQVKVDGGVGNIDFKDVDFKDTELTGGVGNVKLVGKLEEKTQISAGMGNLNIKINGQRQNYNCKVETGLGAIYIDGKKTSEMEYYNNNQPNLLDIEGGVGTIHVDFF